MIDFVWWGSIAEDTSIKPFKINVSQEIIDDLNQRLQKALPLPEWPPRDSRVYGWNTEDLKGILEFWREEYRWREREEFLNKYPQFTVSVEGLHIHYLHVKPNNTERLKVVPLLMLHGWPGSVREFYEIIPFLTRSHQKGTNFVFEVIAPSLPGFGFSNATTRGGLGAVRMAILLKNFMLRVGFSKFYVQGGDWGGIIAQHMAALFAEHIKGIHSNFCFVYTRISHVERLITIYSPSIFLPYLTTETERKQYPLQKNFYRLLREFGTVIMQSQTPDTLGLAFQHNPVGLLAFILEKFAAWTEPQWKFLKDGGLRNRFDITNLLDNVMIYWVTGSMTTSMRLVQGDA
ncbi:hypothetical protein NQ318_017915 [Aromia moschata]|uniref:Epoxide hydrolase n=1 Tax=Aromia moschata TaxID=1265417 RepID=A0AAV8YE65_9CUCU|nr:hypothetical protein NQ318_017915 [Aromia moschata]